MSVQEEEVRRLTLRSLDVLQVDDALRLARSAAERAGLSKAFTANLYEKCVLQQITVLEYLALLRQQVKDEALGSVIDNIQRNIAKFK